jgi:hypothetical protein
MSALPPKADFPILELLPPPALRERRHRGLARRLMAVRRRAVHLGITDATCRTKIQNSIVTADCEVNQFEKQRQTRGRY